MKAILTDRRNSLQIHENACKVIPGGVNSPVRAFQHLKIPPLIVEKGKGAIITDADHNSYIDYCLSWGALILGHAPPQVVKVAQDQVAKGSSFGIATPIEEKFAKKVKDLLPPIDKLRFVSSGTEATMSAIRLARAYSNKPKVLKFIGHYHGHADHLLVKAGSGMLNTNPQATSQGVPHDIIKNTLNIPFNDPVALLQVLDQDDQIGTIILEPIAANMGVVPPEKNYLKLLREESKKRNIVLIFDEVITGFRVGLRGAAGIFGISFDLICLGKILGGGFPAAAFGGRREIMDLLAPLGEVYQAGTLSGNPVAMQAGFMTLSLIEKEGFYQELEEKTAYLWDPIVHFIEKKGLPCVVQRVGSMFTLFFGKKKVHQLESLDLSLFRSFFQYLLERGIYFSPSQYEASFLTSAHTLDHLIMTRTVILDFLRGIP